MDIEYWITVYNAKGEQIAQVISFNIPSRVESYIQKFGTDIELRIKIADPKEVRMPTPIYYEKYTLKALQDITTNRLNRLDMEDRDTNGAYLDLFWNDIPSLIEWNIDYDAGVWK